MKEETKEIENKPKIKKEKNRNCNCAAGNGSIYGLGLIGAAIFFISKASSFGEGFLGFLKALVWPAFMVYEVFKHLIK